MVQNFEHMNAKRMHDDTRPKIRYLLAGALVGGLAATVLPWVAAIVMSGGW
jgi:hypothetical protein